MTLGSTYPLVPELHCESVPSPCIGQCRLDAPGRHCDGCGRTIAEIEAWPGASAAQRRAVWERLRQRRQHVGEEG